MKFDILKKGSIVKMKNDDKQDAESGSDNGIDSGSVGSDNSDPGSNGDEICDRPASRAGVAAAARCGCAV